MQTLHLIADNNDEGIRLDAFLMVEIRGLEPLTSALRTQRSTN